MIVEVDEVLPKAQILLSVTAARSAEVLDCLNGRFPEHKLALFTTDPQSNAILIYPPLSETEVASCREKVAEQFGAEVMGSYPWNELTALQQVLSQWSLSARVLA